MNQPRREYLRVNSDLVEISETSAPAYPEPSRLQQMGLVGHVFEKKIALSRWRYGS